MTKDDTQETKKIMKNTYFTPGPSQMFPGIAKYIKDALANDIPSISHRGKTYSDLFASTTEMLKKLLNIPKDYEVFYISSATEAMERIIENCVKTQSYHFVNGAFSKRFYDTALELKKNPTQYEVGEGKGFTFQKVKIPKTTELICFTHNETSTGVAIDPNNMYEIKKINLDVLIAVDIVSSVPYVALDYALLDCVFFSVQKGFGLPAGLGVLIVSPKALAKANELAKNNDNIGSYHNFPTLSQFAKKNQTPETPNVLGMYLLNRVLQEMLKTGINKIRKQTEQKAKLLYTLFEKNKDYTIFVEDKTLRSQTVIVVDVKNGSTGLIKKLKEKGIVVGTGYGSHKDTQIRIGNFPAITTRDVKKLLRNII